MAEKYGLSTAQLTVRWALTHPAVTSAIIGVKRPDHITGIVKAAEGELSIPDWHALADWCGTSKADHGRYRLITHCQAAASAVILP